MARNEPAKVHCTKKARHRHLQGHRLVGAPASIADLICAATATGVLCRTLARAAGHAFLAGQPWRFVGLGAAVVFRGKLRRFAAPSCC